MHPYDLSRRSHQKELKFIDSETPYILRPARMATIWDIPTGSFLNDPHIGLRRGEHHPLSAWHQQAVRHMNGPQQLINLRKQYYEACYRWRTGKTGDPKLHFQSSFSGTTYSDWLGKEYQQVLRYAKCEPMTPPPFAIELTPLMFLRELQSEEWRWFAVRRSGKSLSMAKQLEIHREKMLDSVRLPMPALNMQLLPEPAPTYRIYDYMDSYSAFHTVSFHIPEHEVKAMSLKIRGASQFGRGKRQAPVEPLFTLDIKGDYHRWANR
ncbi:hypothetical protein FDI21_gp047 [Pseudomonas phage Noxifer]|uniref:Uncharacterized protein n=1 Tax=Pseudomonas phage Noxifer TaxID=2006684 RepID=A0A1Y0T121_9CAUD|nr:hypothetical protein FDI21_gp047 [Pseudomonas phage Noxifer]ARV77218.1 hypothetical protein NOXIFER_47 [Pseudomonas phage Noxifer]